MLLFPVPSQITLPRREMPSTRRNIMSDLPTAVPFDAPTFALSDHFSRLPPRGGVYLKRVATESVVRELLHELGFACKNFKYVLESGQYDSLRVCLDIIITSWSRLRVKSHTCFSL